MPVKKLAVVFVIVAVAIGGFVTGLFLLQQRQDLRERAAVPGGEARVSLTPATGSFNVGDTISTSVNFNTSGIAVSGIAVRILYPFSGSTPEVSVSGIRVSNTLLSSGSWTCPTQNASQQGGNVVIDIACANTSAAGFTSSTDTLLANIDLKINRAPSAVLEVKFDPVGEAAEATPTTQPGSPTTTTRVTSPTATRSITPTDDLGTGGLAESITPTTQTLPDAGVSHPTLLGIGLGTFVILGAMLLAL
jgi:hypothetical protein